MIAAVTLGLGDYCMIGAMLAALGTIITTLMLGNIKALGKRVDRVEDRLMSVEKVKADKHEWARETLLARGKMEKLSGQIGRVDAKLDANFGIAASINRLSDELMKYRKANPHG